jgi:hypothetical protein
MKRFLLFTDLEEGEVNKTIDTIRFRLQRVENHRNLKNGEKRQLHNHREKNGRLLCADLF